MSPPITYPFSGLIVLKGTKLITGQPIYRGPPPKVSHEIPPQSGKDQWSGAWGKSGRDGGKSGRGGLRERYQIACETSFITVHPLVYRDGWGVTPGWPAPTSLIMK